MNSENTTAAVAAPNAPDGAQPTPRIALASVAFACATAAFAGSVNAGKPSEASVSMVFTPLETDTAAHGAQGSQWVRVFSQDFGGNDVADPEKPQTTTLSADEIGSAIRFSGNAAMSGVYYLTKQSTENSDWHKGSDHTYPNDVTRGYYMRINPNGSRSNEVMYVHPLSGICQGVTFKFSAFMSNLQISETGSKPHLGIGVYFDKEGTTLVSSNAFTDITLNKITDVNSTVLPWQELSLVFQMNNSSGTAYFIVCAIQPETNGFDFALDDITIEVLHPTVNITNVDEFVFGQTVRLAADFENDGYFSNMNNVIYKWYYSADGSDYQEIYASSYTNSKDFVYPIQNFDKDKDNGYYRVKIGESGSFESDIYSIQGDFRVNETKNKKLVYLRYGDYNAEYNISADDPNIYDGMEIDINSSLTIKIIIVKPTATYTVKGKTEVETGGDVPYGSYAEYRQTADNAGEIPAGAGLTLTLRNYDGATITGLTLSMKSQADGGGGSLVVTCGDASLAAIGDSKFNSVNWHGEWSEDFVDVAPAVAATVIDRDVMIQVEASEDTLYLESVTVEYKPAKGVRWLYERGADGGAVVTGVHPAEGNLTMPQTLGGMAVTAVGDEAFENCTNITGMAIADSVADIGAEAFRLCTSLTNAWLGTGIESVGAEAFSGCNSLATLWAPVEQEGTGLLDGAGLPDTCAIHWYGTQVVTFDPNGGSCEVVTNGYVIGGTYGALPETLWRWHDFAGWWDDAAGVEVATNSIVTEKAARTLVAHWSGPAPLTDLTQDDGVYGDTLPDPSYVKPVSGGTETIVYSGTNTAGTAYGPTVDKPTEAGRYVVAVTYETHDSIYSGSASFSIKPKDISTAEVGDVETQFYEGRPLEPVPTVTDGIPSIITTNDYAVSWADNNGPGTGRVILTGRNNYTGTNTVSFTILPVPTAALRWKFSSAVGRYFAQVAIPAHTGYDEALGGLAFLFADRTNNVGDVYAQLWNTAARAPQGVLVTDNGVAYRGVALGAAAFAGQAEGARVLWGVADASFAETRNIVPAGAERLIGLYVRKRVNPVSGNETAGEVENFLGYLTWVTDGARWFLPIVEGGAATSPAPAARNAAAQNAPQRRAYAPATLSAAVALGLGAEAVAAEAPVARIAAFAVGADGAVSGRIEAVAGDEASSSFGGAATVRILSAESLGGPWREAASAEVDPATGAFALPAGSAGGRFFRAEIETRTLYE